MAKARVVDLSKREGAEAHASEQFEQQVLKAKTVVNETMDLLFSKNTNLRAAEVPAPKPEEKIEAAKEEPKAEKKSSNLSEIKIGEIKLRGKVQLPTRKVLMNENQLGDMRRNLALFSS